VTIVADRAVSAGQALRDAARRLDAASVDSARLTAEALLAHTLDLSRAQLLARLEQPLPADQLVDYQTLIDRCESGEPLAYVLGVCEFYGLDFRVDPRVLIPRPETELLIDAALDIARARSRSGADYRIADVGAGSGAIAVTLAVRLLQARVVAIDISPEAIEVAAGNARRHGVAHRIEFRVGDLLAPLDAPVDLIAGNLPYVRSAEWRGLARSIREHEPALAFDGGVDGLALIARLLRDAPRTLRPGGSILLEIGAAHGEAALELARDCFPGAECAVQTDLAGLDRLLVVSTQPSKV
jgi:release factor glutamine methyltransferase